MENYDFKSRVKELSESRRGETDFSSEFRSENDPTGITHVCNATFYYKHTNRPPITGQGKRKKKKEAEQEAFKLILDQLLVGSALPVGTSHSEYDRLTRMLLERWGPYKKSVQNSPAPSPPTPEPAETDGIKHLARNLAEYFAAQRITSQPSLPVPGNEPGSRVTSSSSSSGVSTGDGLQVDDLDDDDTLARSLEGSVKNDLTTYCARSTPRYPEPRYEMVYDRTLVDNSHRFKVQCSVEASGSRPQIITYGVAIKKQNAEKIAALKMLEKLQESQGVQQIGSADAVQPPGNSLSQITRPASVGATSSAGLSFSPVSPVRQAQTLPALKGMGALGSFAGSPTKVLPGGILVKDKIVYFPKKRLGEGGSGSNGVNEVYKGYYEIPSKEAAIKRILLVKRDSKCDELKFLRELNHPNVVGYFCTEEKDMYQFIAMELADSTLDKVVLEESDLTVLREYCHDVTKGLAYLHDQNIIHRDLKPSNILIFSRHASKKTAKITDFDISREFNFSRAEITTCQNRGTPTYMPPEALNVGSEPLRLKPSFDIFGLAVVIHFTMTRGKHLFAKPGQDTVYYINVNIIEGNVNWDYTVKEPKFLALRNLLASMIRDADNRPYTLEILEHPFFWDTKKRHEFIIHSCTDINNFSNPDIKSSFKSTILQPRYQRFCQKYGHNLEWINRLCPIVQNWIREKRFKTPSGSAKNYQSQPQSVILLIELIRDQRIHYGNWKDDPELRNDFIFGKDGEKYAQYFEDRFPELAMLLYISHQPEHLQGDMLKSYYAVNVNQVFPDSL